MQDDQTIIQKLSNDEIAEREKLRHAVESIYRKLPLSKEHRRTIAEIADNSSKISVKEATKRLGERAGKLEKATIGLNHKMELKDQLHESDLKNLADEIIKTNKAIDGLKSDVKMWLGAVGFILSLFIAGIAAFK